MNFAGFRTYEKENIGNISSISDKLNSSKGILYNFKQSKKNFYISKTGFIAKKNTYKEFLEIKCYTCLTKLVWSKNQFDFLLFFIKFFFIYFKEEYSDLFCTNMKTVIPPDLS